MPKRKNFRSDKEFIASLDELHGMEAIKAFAASSFSNTSDPYYRDLNEALWRMFERAIEEVEKELS